MHQVIPLSAPLVDATLRYLSQKPHGEVRRLVDAIEGEVQALTQHQAQAEARAARAARSAAAQPPPPPPELPPAALEPPLVPIAEPPPPPLEIPELPPAVPVEGPTPDAVPAMDGGTA